MPSSKRKARGGREISTSPCRCGPSSCSGQGGPGRVGSLCILNSNQRVGCAASPPCPGVRTWHPVGPGAGEAVLRKAVCGHGELPAGVILQCGSCRVLAGPRPCKSGWPSGAFAPEGWRAGLRVVSESCTGHAGWCKDPREAVQGLLQPSVS